ncbi:MAG TPA: bacteriohemerythrin [Burkholderiales bacterium]
MIEWTADLLLGHEAIDAQHREMVVAANGVHRAFAGGSRDARSAALRELRDVTAAHFLYEEELMRKHAYPNAGVHAENHAGLMEQLARLTALLHVDGGGEKVLPFLRGWVVSHIVHFDRDVVLHLNRALPEAHG